MAQLIGVVSKVIGQVFAVAGNGARRAVVEGDRLFAGDTLDTGTQGAVAVHLTNGNELTLGRGSSLHIDGTLLSDQPPNVVVHDESAPNNSQLSEVQQAQQAIAAGADPTQTLEATAAGPAGATVYTNTPAGDLGGGHSFVLLTETGGTVNPSIGFPTNGLDFALLDTPPEVARPLAGDDTGAIVPPVVTPPGEPPVVTPPNEPPVVTPPNEPPVTTTPPDNGITFVNLYKDGGEQRVFEADLPNGTSTDPNKAAELTRAGTFNVVAPDGLASLTIDGVQVVTNGVLAGDSVQIVGQLGNTLTITGYDPATGLFNYTYVLSTPGENNQTTSNTELSEDFHLVANDTDGDTGDAWLNVRITDDSPLANPDTNSVNERAPDITGTVLTNDLVGADVNASPVTPMTVTTAYGTLTLAADGTYTYVLNTAGDAFKALLGGESTQDQFTYTLTDGDGDKTTTTLTINVTNIDDNVSFGGLKSSGGDLTFSEADLPNGTNTDPNKAANLTKEGTFSVDAKDGLASLTIAGKEVLANGVLAGTTVEVQGQWGNTLTITDYNATTGVFTYHYTLSIPGDNNPLGVNEPLANTQLSDDFQMVATDRDGDKSTAYLNITVLDDAPLAVDDVAAKTATEQLTKITGSVLGNDIVGADANASPVTPETINGKYGTLVLNADGTYTYTLDAKGDAFKALLGGEAGTPESFTYTLTDGDGDKSTATLTVNVLNLDDGVTINWLKSSGGDLIFKESHLPDGTSTEPNKAQWLTDHSSFQVDAKDGLDHVTIGGVDVVVGGKLVSDTVEITGQWGNILTITHFNESTGVFSYEYTLAIPGQNNAPGQGNALANTQLSDDFNIVATDRDGDTDSAWINITIKDDSPVARNDHNRTDATDTQQTLTGDVLTNDKVGADSNATPVSLGKADGSSSYTAQGLYGTLVMGSDGKYTYTLDTSSEAYQSLKSTEVKAEHFTYTLTDGDGDSTTATLTLDVKGINHDVGISFDADLLIAQESNLKGGSTYTPGGETVDGKITVSAPDGVQNLTVGGITVMKDGVVADFPGSITTAEGNTLTVIGYDPSTGVVQYAYTMDHALEHPTGDGANSITETFTVAATDKDGSTASANFNVEVVDDVPLASAIDKTVNVTASGTNVLLVIDVSNSMNDKVGNTGLSRLDLAKQAIDQMLQQYADQGDVKVQVTTFNNQTHQVSNAWVDVGTAIQLVDGLKAGGGTNYDYALDGARTAYAADGKLTGAGVQTVSYFVSDGNPTLSSTHDHVTSQQSGNKTDPLLGDGIDTTEKAAWDTFLDANGIKSITVGIGPSASAQYLDPISHDGTTKADTSSLMVRDVTQLLDALSGTVSVTPVVGALTRDGGFGADGGFVQSISVDGVKYSFDGGSQLTAGQGAGQYSFDGASHTLTVTTQEGGVLKVDMDNGKYVYTPAADAATSSFTETVLFTLSDKDGDTSSNVLSVHVLIDPPVTASAENIITNVYDSSITVPTDALLANASAGTHLVGSNTFNTGWSTGFSTGSSVQTIAFDGTANTRSNRVLELDRTQFTANAALMTAVLVVSGYLGAVEQHSSNDEDTLTVSLKKGETVHLDSNSSASIAWAADGGHYTSLQGDSFTANADGLYKIHITNVADADHGVSAENYTLTLTVDYSQAVATAPLHTDTYTVADSDGHSASAAVAIHYQAGHDLVGTNGNDVIIAGDGENRLQGGEGNDTLVAGDGGNDLYGNNGNDLLISGAGNDLLDGGAGNNTASYQNAHSGVWASLGGTDADGFNTHGGGGHDTLVNIQNLIGSDYNDHLIGDAGNNLLIGGKGSDTLTGGGGADTFKWLSGDEGQNGSIAHDTVTDFKPGVDTLDLSQLLQGANSVANSLENFLQFKVTGSGSELVSTIEISTAGNNTTNQTIALDHVDLASNYGVTVGAGGIVANGHDTATIISGMLNDHSLKADTV